MRYVEKFVILDLDRTLLKTDDFFQDSLNALVDSGYISSATSEIIAQHVQASQGMDTDWVGMIAATSGYSTAAIAKPIYHSLLTKDGLVYFYHGVGELFEWLKTNEIPFVVMTKGSIATQEIKLALMKHVFTQTIPSFITDTPSKAAWITDNIREEAGCKVLPALFNQSTLRVKKIYIVDDKPEHLQSDSDAIIGIRIDNSLNTSPGAIPIASLTQLLDGE